MMKLIIREYLSLLKESAELDLLLPDLLLSMGIEPISHAQIGVRQYGVDVAAVGTFKDDERTLYLFTIKLGDLGRKDWDTNEQSIKQSLGEIEDVYLEAYIRPEHAQLPKKIILCTGGDLKQEIELTWNTYVSKHSIEGKVEYDFWGGDRLSLLIEEYMFNEHLLPKRFRSYLRKVLSLLSDPDYDLSDYYRFLYELLLNFDFGDLSKQSSQKKVAKSFRTIHLCLNIIYAWSRDENNLKPALKAGERTVLLIWEFLRKNDLLRRRALLLSYHGIYRTFFLIYTDYFSKIHDHCYVQDALHIYSKHFILECLNIFENLGIISAVGISYLFQSISEQDEELHERAKIISDATKAMIKNHLATRTPIYDTHIIEISMAIYLLAAFSEFDFLHDWIQEIANHIAYAYQRMGKYFPIHSDSFDDLVSLNVSGTIDRAELMKMSTLFPILAQWCVTLNFEDVYHFIRNMVEEIFPTVALQIWYPDSKTEQFLYTCNAAYESGAVEAPIILPESLGQMKEMMKKVQTNTIKLGDLSCIMHGFPMLSILTSRHYRTPFLPLHWQPDSVHENES